MFQTPKLRFVPVKNETQQEIISVHRIRHRLVKARLQLTNQARGLLSEFGIIFPQGHKAFKNAPSNIESAENLSFEFQQLILSLKDEYDILSEKIKKHERYLNSFLENNENCQIVHSIPGIGCLTATAIVATIDKGQAFSKASDIGVWLGLTPKQYASGNKSYNGGISKRGDQYLRCLLVQGANTAIQWAKKRNDKYSLWIKQLVIRIGRNKAVVAIAHKMARLAWILLQKRERFQIKTVH